MNVIDLTQRRWERLRCGADRLIEPGYHRARQLVSGWPHNRHLSRPMWEGYDEHGLRLPTWGAIQAQRIQEVLPTWLDVVDAWAAFRDFLTEAALTLHLWSPGLLGARRWHLMSIDPWQALRWFLAPWRALAMLSCCVLGIGLFVAALLLIAAAAAIVVGVGGTAGLFLWGWDAITSRCATFIASRPLHRLYYRITQPVPIPDEPWEPVELPARTPREPINWWRFVEWLGSFMSKGCDRGAIPSHVLKSWRREDGLMLIAFSVPVLISIIAAGVL